MERTTRLFAAMLVAVALWAIWGAGWPNWPRFILVERDAVSLSELSGAGWQQACFAPAYHHLHKARAPGAMSACWDAQDVPPDMTYLTLVLANGTCARYRFAADFIVRGGGDLRCFSHAEDRDIHITLADGILSLR